MKKSAVERIKRSSKRIKRSTKRIKRSFKITKPRKRGNLKGGMRRWLRCLSCDPQRAEERRRLVSANLEGAEAAGTAEAAEEAVVAEAAEEEAAEAAEAAEEDAVVAEAEEAAEAIRVYDPTDQRYRAPQMTKEDAEEIAHEFINVIYGNPELKKVPDDNFLEWYRYILTNKDFIELISRFGISKKSCEYNDLVRTPEVVRQWIKLNEEDKKMFNLYYDCICKDAWVDFPDKFTKVKPCSPEDLLEKIQLSQFGGKRKIKRTKKKTQINRRTKKNKKIKAGYRKTNPYPNL